MCAVCVFECECEYCVSVMSVTNERQAKMLRKTPHSHLTQIWHCIWQQWGIWHRLRLNCNLPDNIQRHFGCNCKMFLSSLPNIIKYCCSMKKKIEKNIICCDKKRGGIKRFREKQMIKVLMTKKKTLREIAT